MFFDTCILRFEIFIYTDFFYRYFIGYVALQAQYHIIQFSNVSFVILLSEAFRDYEVGIISHFLMCKAFNSLHMEIIF